MKRTPQAFKETQLFDWDSEPQSERPSEFHSTGFSTASGYYHSLGDGSARAKVKRKGRYGPLTAGLLVIICVGWAGVEFLAHLLRA